VEHKKAESAQATAKLLEETQKKNEQIDDGTGRKELSGACETVDCENGEGQSSIKCRTRVDSCS
jgi:hypothetical protein